MKKGEWGGDVVGASASLIFAFLPLPLGEGGTVTYFP